MNKYVLITGNLFDGFTFFGPFTEEKAKELMDLFPGPRYLVRMDNESEYREYCEDFNKE